MASLAVLPRASCLASSSRSRRPASCRPIAAVSSPSCCCCSSSQPSAASGPASRACTAAYSAREQHAAARDEHASTASCSHGAGTPTATKHLASVALAAAAILACSSPLAAQAFELQTEPANALSLPTWAIHVSSVVEWITAMVSTANPHSRTQCSPQDLPHMNTHSHAHKHIRCSFLRTQGLFWKYAEVSGNQTFKGMTWGMLPSLGSAMCACTWHFFYNAPSLEFLVALQVGQGSQSKGLWMLCSGRTHCTLGK
jgi:hypothetical protein